MSSGFDTLGLSSDLQEVVAELGYERPTAIQVRAIPPILSGRDLLGQSKTGSGKTAAFALPLLQSIELEGRRLQALVLCPTRELCAQVARDFRKLGRRHPGLQVLSLAGGEPLRPQANALERGVHVAVGTPGRVVDHLTRATLDLGQVQTAVLDEADRMLDMGFEEQMDQILSKLPTRRQTLLFSATFPESIRDISLRHQRAAVHIEIDVDGGETDQGIQELCIELAGRDREAALLPLLAGYLNDSAIIFCNMKVTVARVAALLKQAGVSAASLHGDLEQYQRDRVMARFRNKSIRVLVATDVAARGIDVEDLELVINYDLPHSAEVYVHRVGRTGRAGKHGLALSLYDHRGETKIREIQRHTGRPMNSVTASSIVDSVHPSALEKLRRPALMQTVEVAGGRKDKVRPGDLLGALTGEAGGLMGTQVGKIELHARHCFVAIATEVAEKAALALSDGKIKGRRFRAKLLR